jgi:hypothetical protein
MRQRARITVLLLGVFFWLPAGLTPQGQIVMHHKVTSVVASFSHSEILGDKQIRVHFSARIACDSYGTVRYRWFRSDGGRGREEEIRYTAAGKKDVTTSWTRGAAHPGETVWEAVEITFPNKRESNKASYTIPDTAFKVLAVSNRVTPNAWAGACPKTFQVSSEIQANGRGTAKYRWVRSDGGATPPVDLVFEGPGTKTVTTSWTLSNTDFQAKRRWITAEVVYPNHILPQPDEALSTGFRPYAASFDLQCTDIQRNPRQPIRFSVGLSGMGIEPNYQCTHFDFPPTARWIKGQVTVRNLSAYPLECVGHYLDPGNNKLRVVVLYPMNPEALTSAPTWPYIPGGDRYWGWLTLAVPQVLPGNGQFTISLARCYGIFEKHPMLYVGAVYEDDASGRKIVSNLVKWEFKW